MQVAVGALYLEAMPSNGITMRAARNERHVVPSRGHPPAEIASDGTRRHDRDPHVATSAEQGITSLKTGTLEKPVRAWRHGIASVP
jgi:predicted subunit of tRNA(5-methylaminomethyl-2-thiouridylate) methyltransferase